MSTSDRKTMRVAFQGEPGAFSEAAAIQLLGGAITTVPRATFEAAFTAIAEGAADAFLAPAQCERFFSSHPELKRIPAEDTAGSVREVLARGDKSSAAIAGRRAADHYKGVILAESVQDNAENFTRFVLLLPESQAAAWLSPDARKVSLAMRLAHRPGALLASLAPFAKHAVNLLKIESRPIHGRPWEYQFFMDVEAGDGARLDLALAEVRSATSELRVLGRYAAACVSSL